MMAEVAHLERETPQPPNCHTDARQREVAMGQEQRQALTKLFTDDDGFKAAIIGATSVEDSVRIAREYGIDADVDDFASRDEAGLTEGELDEVSGGTLVHWPLTFTCMPGS